MLIILAESLLLKLIIHRRRQENNVVGTEFTFKALTPSNLIYFALAEPEEGGPEGKVKPLRNFAAI